MNKLIYLVALATVFMFGCSKEKINEQMDNQSYSGIKLKTLSSDGRVSITTMLEFSNIDAYEATIADLEAKLEAHDDAFVQQYRHLDDDALNEKEEEVGFNDQLPLIDFENQLGFQNSMRQIFVVEEENWLDNETLVSSTDPSNTYVFGIAEMAILNENGEVKIGSSLLKLTKDGFVEFMDGDINKLKRFNNGDMSVLNEKNVVTSLDKASLEKASKSANCKSWKGKDVDDAYAYNKKVKKHVHFHAYPWKGTSEAQITSYKKRGSRWKKYRMNLGVANQSYFFDNDECSVLKIWGWTGWKRKNRKSINKRFTSWGAFPVYRAKNWVSVWGYYEYAGNSNNEKLSW